MTPNVNAASLSFCLHVCVFVCIQTITCNKLLSVILVQSSQDLSQVVTPYCGVQLENILCAQYLTGDYWGQYHANNPRDEICTTNHRPIIPCTFPNQLETSAWPFHYFWPIQFHVHAWFDVIAVLSMGECIPTHHIQYVVVPSCHLSVQKVIFRVSLSNKVYYLQPWQAPSRGGPSITACLVRFTWCLSGWAEPI